MGKVVISRNGIDLDLVAAGVRGAGQRDPHRIVHTIRPERGLEVLLEEVFPRILAEEPCATLHLAAHGVPQPDIALQHIYKRLQELAEGFGDRVVTHGALAKRDLYRLMATAGLFLYPTPAPSAPAFRETSCISCMESLACGLSWLSTDAGALHETAADAGVTVPLNGAPHAAAGDMPQRLAAEALRIMHDPAHAERLRTAGLKRVADLGWGDVADQFLALAAENAGKPTPKPRAAMPVSSHGGGDIVDQALTSALANSGSHFRQTMKRTSVTPPLIAIATPLHQTAGVHPAFVHSLISTNALQWGTNSRMQWLSTIEN